MDMCRHVYLICKENTWSFPKTEIKVKTKNVLLKDKLKRVKQQFFDVCLKANSLYILPFRYRKC